MQIKINGGGLLTGATIGDYQTDLSGYISKSNDIISSFKTVKSQTCSLNGGVSSYTSNAMNDIDHRLAEEGKKREATITIQNKSNDFLALAQRVDNEVAKDVKKNKDEFYKTTKFSRPAVQPLEKRWYEKAADWLDWFFSPAKTKKDREKKAKIYKWIIVGAGIAASTALMIFAPGLGVVAIGAIVGAASSGANNLVDQYVEKGNLIENWDKIEWGSFIKASVIGGITGAVTAWVGSSVGKFLTEGLRATAIGGKLLASSSTFIRVGTSAIIGGASQVGSGILTRGTAAVIQGVVEGNLDMKTVWNSMFNGQSMLFDMAFGLAIGGGQEFIKIRNESNEELIDWDNTANTKEELEYIKEIDNDINTPEEYRTPSIDTNASEPKPPTMRTPKNSGTIIKSDTEGNFEFIPNDEEARRVMKLYGQDTISVESNSPKFDPYTRHETPWGEVDCQVEVAHMGGERLSSGSQNSIDYNKGNYAQANEALAKKISIQTGQNISVKDVEGFINNPKSGISLTWHEVDNGHTMQLVPTVINETVPHTGGTAIMKWVQRMGDVSLNFD